MDFQGQKGHSSFQILCITLPEKITNLPITERCIRQMGRTLQDVIYEWITKLNNREIDRTRMPLNHAEMVIVGTHVCKKTVSTTCLTILGIKFSCYIYGRRDEIMKCTLYICRYIL